MAVCCSAIESKRRSWDTLVFARLPNLFRFMKRQSQPWLALKSGCLNFCEIISRAYATICLYEMLLFAARSELTKRRTSVSNWSYFKVCFLLTLFEVRLRSEERNLSSWLTQPYITDLGMLNSLGVFDIFLFNSRYLSITSSFKLTE